MDRYPRGTSGEKKAEIRLGRPRKGLKPYLNHTLGEGGDGIHRRFVIYLAQTVTVPFFLVMVQQKLPWLWQGAHSWCHADHNDDDENDDAFHVARKLFLG